jgi:hypothetical protein
MTTQRTAITASTIAKVLALSIFLGGSGVGYVFQNGQIRGLNSQAKRNDERIHELEERRKNLKFRLAAMTSRDKLELSARYHKLDLRMPDPGQVITLPEPGRERATGIKLVNRP